MKFLQKNILSLSILTALLATGGCADKIDQTASSPLESEASSTIEAETEPPMELTDRAKELLAQNPDTVGWISIPETKVDNVVVQTTDNDYYLSTGFDGQPFRAGTVFMDFRDTFGENEKTWSENIILYGHNMADNTMFGSLRRYRQDVEFYKTSPFITFSSNYKDYTYVIFGLIITGGDDTTSDFLYWNMEELDTEAEFNQYVDNVKSRNMIADPVDVRYGDQLLTLSTCYTDEDNSRFVIVARRVREEETTDALLQKIQSESEQTTSAANS